MRRVTSGYHGSKMSGSQESLLRETAICIDCRTVEKSISMGYRFVPKCNYAEKSHTCPFFALNLPYLQDHKFLRSRHFASTAT